MFVIPVKGTTLVQEGAVPSSDSALHLKERHYSKVNISICVVIIAVKSAIMGAIIGVALKAMPK